MKNLKLFSLIIGAIYTVLVGFFIFPIFLQASITYLLVLGLIYWVISKKNKLSLFDNIIFAITGILAVYLSITSNSLVQLFTNLSIFTVISYYLLVLNYGVSSVKSGSTFLTESIEFYFVVFINLFNYQRITSYLVFPTRKDFGKVSFSKDVKVGLFLTIPVLFVFHIFFANINAEYSVFMGDILRQIWNLIINFWKYLKYIPQILLNGYIVHTVVTINTKKVVTLSKDKMKNKLKKRRTFNITILSTILISTILLFAIFSFFQSKLIFSGLSDLVFKALSLYTQQGFWELLVVCFLGYLLISFVIRRIELEKIKNNKAVLITSIFTVQLLLVSFFTHHKLFVLEQVFGLKDQRVLATAAVSLVSLTFVLVLLRLKKKLSSATLLKTQLIALVGVIAILNIGNVDLFLTKTYPIRYFHEEKAYKDYSYLLGNSYDNYSQWLAIMEEAMETGVPTPDNYYWGNYRAVRVRVAVENISSVSRSSTYLREKSDNLINKYSYRQSLRDYSKFNLNEWLASKYLSRNYKSFDKFYNYLETSTD